MSDVGYYLMSEMSESQYILTQGGLWNEDKINHEKKRLNSFYVSRSVLSTVNPPVTKHHE